MSVVAIRAEPWLWIYDILQCLEQQRSHLKSVGLSTNDIEFAEHA